MLFSIIIPTYNSESVIRNALNSVIGQTFVDFEILIMDGCSTDRTLAIASSFNDERIKIFSEKDKGIYDAMNKGIKLARGKWLYFLGSDDTLFDRNVLKDVEQYASNNESGVIYGNVKIVGNAGWSSDGQIYDGKFDLVKLLRKNIAHQCIFYPRHSIQNESYNLQYTVCADYDLNLRLYRESEFKYLDRIIANFKGGGYSLIATDTEFSLSKAYVQYFFSKLWQTRFSFLREEIKYESGRERDLFKKIYLYAVYFKHKLF